MQNPSHLVEAEKSTDSAISGSKVLLSDDQATVFERFLVGNGVVEARLLHYARFELCSLEDHEYFELVDTLFKQNTFKKEALGHLVYKWSISPTEALDIYNNAYLRVRGRTQKARRQYWSAQFLYKDPNSPMYDIAREAVVKSHKELASDKMETNSTSSNYEFTLAWMPYLWRRMRYKIAEECTQKGRFRSHWDVYALNSIPELDLHDIALILEKDQTEIKSILERIANNIQTRLEFKCWCLRQPVMEPTDVADTLKTTVGVVNPIRTYLKHWELEVKAEFFG